MPEAARLILVRHAAIECSFNGAALLCGSHNAPLSRRGREQVLALGAKLSAEPAASALYSSPLRRALETAQAAAPELVAAMRVVPELAEIDCGAVEGLPLQRIEREYAELWRMNLAQKNPGFRWPGGESYSEFRQRVLRGIRQIAARHSGERVLLFTHAGVVNQVLGAMAGQSAAHWENFRPGNASLTEVLWQGGTGEVLRFSDPSEPEREVAASESASSPVRVQPQRK